MDITLFDFAERFVGVREINGDKDNPFIVWCHESCGLNETPDEVPWCSSFVNRLCWMLRLPRSKSAAARSWLEVGWSIPLDNARVGFDVVILKRGKGSQPGPEVTRGAPGHVGIFAGIDGSSIFLLGGNQSDAVTVSKFPVLRILGVKRLRR